MQGQCGSDVAGRRTNVVTSQGLVLLDLSVFFVARRSRGLRLLLNQTPMGSETTPNFWACGRSFATKRGEVVGIVRQCDRKTQHLLGRFVRRIEMRIEVYQEVEPTVLLLTYAAYIHLRGRFEAPPESETLVRRYYETKYADTSIRTTSKVIEGTTAHDHNI